MKEANHSQFKNLKSIQHRNSLNMENKTVHKKITKQEVGSTEMVRLLWLYCRCFIFHSICDLNCYQNFSRFRSYF